MEILSYSPSVEAYVRCNRNGALLTYDISEDIVSADVFRNSDAASTFSLTLQNPRHKYNGAFMPMDAIVIYATKMTREKLISGYINTVDAFTLYESDFKMSGSCTLYRAEKMYFDPGLQASIELMLKTRNSNRQWGGYGETIYDLLTEIGGWSYDTIGVGEIPNEAIEWAREMYEAQQDDAAQITSMVDEFYEILQAHGPDMSVGAMGGSAAQRAVCSLYTSWEGKFDYSQADGRLDPVKNGYGDCSSTIWRAYYDTCGIDVGQWTGAMINKGTLVAKGQGELPISKMQPADLIIVNHRYHNDTYDHVELYLGDDRYAGHGGGRGPTIKEGAKAYGAREYDWQIRRHL